MKKRTLFIALFTLGLFYFYYQIFSFSSQRMIQIERTFDPVLSITKTCVLLVPVDEKEKVEEAAVEHTDDMPLSEEEDAFLQLNTTYFSFVLKL